MTPLLTIEQRAVAELPVDARALVTAGPGTGKTHTLIARLVHLVEAFDAAPGEIVAFTFTRAAAGEMRRRLSALGTDARAVRPTTLDSFVSSLLYAWAPDGPWRERSFDDRITAATAVIGDLTDHLSTIVHLCVDELQDLVGVRAEFMRRLIESTGCGFTLFGDPAQGIYNFSLGSGSSGKGSPAFYAWLRTGVPSLQEYSLTTNHRVLSHGLDGIFDLRSAILGGKDDSTTHATVANWVKALPPLPSWEVLARDPRSTAVLCRNNGRASVTAGLLRSMEVPVTLRRTGRSMSVPRWVALLARDVATSSISRSRFEHSFARLPTSPDVAVDDAWRSLRRLSRSPAGIDLDRLRTSLRSGITLDDLTPTESSGVVVSTIHRAKGLEFDKVVIIDEFPGADDIAEEARVLYVALTRARRLAMRATPEPKVRFGHDRHDDRWAVMSWNGGLCKELELLPEDVDRYSPPGFGLRSFDPRRAQELLERHVRPGDPVELDEPRRASDARTVTYIVRWNGEPIAETSEAFSHALRRQRRYEGRFLATRITNAWVDQVETVASEPALTIRSGLGDSGFWLVPRLTGLGRLTTQEDQ